MIFMKIFVCVLDANELLTIIIFPISLTYLMVISFFLWGEGGSWLGIGRTGSHMIYSANY